MLLSFKYMLGFYQQIPLSFGPTDSCEHKDLPLLFNKLWHLKNSYATVFNQLNNTYQTLASHVGCALNSIKVTQ